MRFASAHQQVRVSLCCRLLPVSSRTRWPVCAFWRSWDNYVTRDFSPTTSLMLRRGKYLADNIWVFRMGITSADATNAIEHPAGNPQRRLTGHKRHSVSVRRLTSPERRLCLGVRRNQSFGRRCWRRSSTPPARSAHLARMWSWGRRRRGTCWRRAAMIRRVLLARRWYLKASPESRAARGRGSVGLLVAGSDLVRRFRWAGDCRCAGAAVVGLGFRGEWRGWKGGPHGPLGRARGRGEQRAEMPMVTLVSAGSATALTSWSGCQLGWPHCRGPSAPPQNAVQRGIPGGLVPPAGRTSSGAVSWSTSSLFPGLVSEMGALTGLGRVMGPSTAL